MVGCFCFLEFAIFGALRLPACLPPCLIHPFLHARTPYISSQTGVSKFRNIVGVTASLLTTVELPSFLFWLPCCKLSINNHIVGLVHKNHIIRTCLMYNAACKVEFQPFKRSYSQLTFLNVVKQGKLYNCTDYSML